MNRRGVRCLVSSAADQHPDSNRVRDQSVRLRDAELLARLRSQMVDVPAEAAAGHGLASAGELSQRVLELRGEAATAVEPTSAI